MSAEIRVVVIAASGAFVLSALIGLFSQVAFLSLMLRAFLSGLGFAALTAGAYQVVRKFLPEMLGEPSVLEGADAPLQDTEHHLNIVLPGEGEDTPTEVEEIVPSANLAAPLKIGEKDLQEFEREAEEIGADSLVPRESGESEEAPKPVARPPASFEDLDVLPDLDSLSDVFAPPAHEDIDAGQAPVNDPISTTGASRDGVDAATMAQAIRTLLKRDQKG